MMRFRRIAAAAACALLLTCPASAQLIGSGHVMGNGKGSAAAPTDTPLLNVMNQPGSGLGAGVGLALSYAPNTAGGVALFSASSAGGGARQASA
jgi:hypothetical protein